MSSSIPTSTSVTESAVIQAPLSQVWHQIKLQDFHNFWTKLSKSEHVQGASPETDIVKWTFEDGTVLDVKLEEHSVGALLSQNQSTYCQITKSTRGLLRTVLTLLSLYLSSLCVPGTFAISLADLSFTGNRSLHNLLCDRLFSRVDLLQRHFHHPLLCCHFGRGRGIDFRAMVRPLFFGRRRW